MSESQNIYRWKKYFQVQLSKQKNDIQFLDWKYGRIIFTLFQTNITQLFKLSQPQILLTTPPFLGSPYPTLILPSQQGLKQFQTIQKILQFFILQKANRNTHIVIKGGGFIMDVGGLATGIYMRGINNVTIIPTTMLGIVDATIGGKTAVNFNHAKNLIGSFRNPNTIIICTQFLKTQSQRHFFNGIVETIKMALTYDKQFFQFLQTVDFQNLRNQENSSKLQKIIKKSLQLKMSVVQKDLNQKNQRKWLNFGHTIGHAIQLDEQNDLLHGQCVAIGIVKALQLSIKKGIIKSQSQNIRSRVIKILKKLKLSTQVPKKVNIEKMLQRMLKDKKKSSNRIQQIDFVMIQQIGKRCPSPTIVSISQLKQLLCNYIQIKHPCNTNLTNINPTFPFPSSKSISLRYLYIYCLAYLKNFLGNNNLKKQMIIQNFLSSQDTEKMIYSLRQIGFQFQIQEDKRFIKIIGYSQKSNGYLDVGNSGITARFILPLCLYLKGNWHIACHQRMEERPNEQIFKLCQQNFQGKIHYLKRNHCFPVRIQSNGIMKERLQIKVEGKTSSQFISSAMINWSFFQPQTTIHLQNSSSSPMVSQSYILITKTCLSTFNILSNLSTSKTSLTLYSSNLIVPPKIKIQKDLSTYSYAFIFALFHDFKEVQIEMKGFMQGDVFFYQYVRQLIDKVKTQQIIRFDFNNCTDTFMTLAVFCCNQQIVKKKAKKIIIYNISNQRLKQSNRIFLTIKNLHKIGIFVKQYQNEIQITLSTIDLSNKREIIFETMQDHRLAMSFGILSSYLSKKFPQTKFIVCNPSCVQKTFPQFWQYLCKCGIQLTYLPCVKYSYQTLPTYHPKSKPPNSIILIGNRGCGKTTLGKTLAKEKGWEFIDIDDVVREEINRTIGLESIEQCVERYGWDRFREIQSNVLQDVIINKNYSRNDVVIATGGGVLDKEINRYVIQRQKQNVIYLQRPFQQLKYKRTSHRPSLPNFQQLSIHRQFLYQSLCSFIITFPQWLSQQSQQKYFISCLKKSFQPSQLKQGYILCLNQFQLLSHQEEQEVNTIEIRIDRVLEKERDLKRVRRELARWRNKYQHKDLILTLRTKQELGQFDDQLHNYNQVMDSLTQIPCDFIDHQITKPIKHTYNHNKLLLSYHGNNEQMVKKLLSQPYGFKKFCYWQKDHQFAQKSINLFHKYKHNFDKGICIDMSNPFSRFQTKYQMIVQEKHALTPTSTGIMSLSQMKNIKRLMKFK